MHAIRHEVMLLVVGAGSIYPALTVQLKCGRKGQEVFTNLSCTLSTNARSGAMVTGQAGHWEAALEQ